MKQSKCEKCGEIFCGWSDSDTCPNCGGKLKPMEGNIEGRAN